MVGPFIFFDQMGPGEFLAGSGLDVRPHPHIGLSTATYLFEGSILHRDSLGSRQPILPGDVNWMTAGRGIAHSERTDATLRVRSNRLFGTQSWVALPKAAEETAPTFTHHPGATLPVIEDSGIRLRLIAGEGWGSRAPVTVSSPRFYADAVLVADDVKISGHRFEPGRLLVFQAGDPLALHAGPQGARVLLLGGAAIDGPRFLLWNFVSSSRERIEQAKADWKAGRFGKVPGDEEEFIPLPERARVRAEGRPSEPSQVSAGSPTS